MTFFFKDIQWACSSLALWSPFIPSHSHLGDLHYSIPALAWGWPDGSCLKCFLVTPIPVTILGTWGEESGDKTFPRRSLRTEVGLGRLAYVLSQVWIWCRLLPVSQSLTLSSSNPSPQRPLGVTELLALSTTLQVCLFLSLPHFFFN